MSTTYEIPPAAVQVTLQRELDAVLSDAMEVEFAPLLEEFHGDLEAAHAEGFAGAVSPGGRAWPKLAPSTIRRKGHATILVDSGRLRASLQGRTADSIREVVDEGLGRAGLSFGTDVEYAKFHQEGTARIPQREHVGAGEELIQQFENAIADTFIRAITET